MFMRKMVIAALLGAAIASVGCGCCHKGRVVSYGPPPCCGGAVPAGPVAVPAPPAPVTAQFAPAAPCPTCAGR
jgi:hypothetical protein